MKFASALLAFAGIASAKKIPLKKNELTYDDLMAQKEYYTMRAYANAQ